MFATDTGSQLGNGKPGYSSKTAVAGFNSSMSYVLIRHHAMGPLQVTRNVTQNTLDEAFDIFDIVIVI